MASHTSFTMLKIYKALSEGQRLDSSAIVELLGDTRQVVYKSLNTLHSRKWVKKEEEKGGRSALGRTPKNFYSLTVDGKKELEIAAKEVARWVCK